ncbi:MAG: alpha/beta fold hydrolase [Candidatus Microgenomates bacterium]|jgi:dipeptidyl aminopeptidase/acylaminoacyl peptidase
MAAQIIARITTFIALITGIFHSASGIILTSTPIIQNPLAIQTMRAGSYPGSNVTFEQTLPSGSNYKRYIVSFYSQGLKEYAYLTIPNTGKPQNGFPVIIFNHGYQTPELYTPEGNYIAYMDALAKAGYVIFKPDYRGNGKSQGAPTSSYFSPNYTVDDLNAISSVKNLEDPKTGLKVIDNSKIGMWGHSMGGAITLRASEISPDIKAVVIWGGVVGSYNDIIYNWQDAVSYKPAKEDLTLRNLGLAALLTQYGNPTQNPDFWDSVDPSANVAYITAPVQIHVGGSDEQVPSSFSKYLYNQLIAAGKTAEFYSYPGANHDIAQGFSPAMKRTIDFFDRYLK